MRPQKSDVTVYVFALGVMLSGAWMAEQFGTTWSPTLLALVGAVAAIWTAYHRFAVAPRLGAHGGDAAGRRDGGTATDAGDAADTADASAGNDI